MKRSVRLDQQEIVKLGTPKKTLLMRDRLLISLSKNDGVSINQAFRNMNYHSPSGGYAMTVLSLSKSGLVTRNQCACGQGYIIFITGKGRKYVRDLLKK